MLHTEQLSASLEDYLEAIFQIISTKGAVRAKDIAGHLGVKAGSVTTALKALARSEHINYQPYEVITLTSKGMEQAREIIRKHEVLKDFFVEILGADPNVAEAGACKIEHVIPERLVRRLISFTEFIQACPRCGSDMIEKFQRYFNKLQSCDIEQCHVCLGQSIDHLEKEKEKMSSSTTQTTLLDIPNGSKCIVKSIKKKASATKRLVEMGISRGAIVEVERVAPLGDPIEVKVKGYHLSIRKDEARHIDVELQ
jgi:DtxR family transcriptional regulator, Mn-dependent transcriptional regulator